MLTEVIKSPAQTQEGFDSHSVYDQYPNGIGEVPPDVPGVRTIETPGLKSQTEFEEKINGGVIGNLINDLNKNGKHVGAKWKAGEVTLFVAKHPGAIIAGSLGVSAAIAGIFYLIKKKDR